MSRSTLSRPRAAAALLSAAVAAVVTFGSTAVATADVFSSPATGTHTVSGAILTTYRAEGGSYPGSRLGYPLTSELRTPDGLGRFNVFERGSIYWTPWTGAHAVRGAIRDNWAAHGWERGQLGYPTTGELFTPDRRGSFNSFQRGGIYWTQFTGAHAVYGAIYQRWGSLGWEAGQLRFPTTDELSTPDGRGRFTAFSGGLIYWTPSTGAHAVWGAVLQAYAYQGYETGPLGYPTTSELATPYRFGRFNHFERGSIYWSPQTGSHPVSGEFRAAWAELGWENSELGFPISSEYAVEDGGRAQDFEFGWIEWYPGEGAYVFLDE